MGEVIKTRISSGKIIYKIELDENEAIQLKNHVKKVHFFSEDLCTHKARIISRGAKGGAKYFVLPLGLKTKKKMRYSEISYQKVITKDKVFYICVANKDPLF